MTEPKPKLNIQLDHCEVESIQLTADDSEGEHYTKMEAIQLCLHEHCIVRLKHHGKVFKFDPDEILNTIAVYKEKG